MKATLNWLNVGVQTFQHAFRMGMQAFRLLVFTFIVVYVTCFVSFIYIGTKSTERYDGYKTVEAISRNYLYKKVEKLELRSLNKHINSMRFHARNVLATHFVRELNIGRFNQWFLKLFKSSAWFSFYIAMIFNSLLLIYFVRRGEKIKSDNIIRGPKIVSNDEFNRALKQQNLLSRVKISTIHMKENFETEGTLFEGTTGSGKTVGMNELSDEAQRTNAPQIYYDIEGTFTERYYRPGIDTMLSPFDIRGVDWTIWAEGCYALDYERMASALIPLSPGASDEQQFWVSAARTIFSVAAEVLNKRGKPTLSELVRSCITADMKAIEKLAKNTIAESLMSQDAAKLALSVKAVLTRYVKSFMYLNEPASIDTAFSIKKWVIDSVENPSDRRLFITSSHEHHVVLKPLISVWLDIAANSILSLSENLDRRIWLFIDELPTLQRLDCLSNLLSLGRKRGLCAVISMQGRTQLYTHYTKDVGRGILNVLNTRFYGRAPDYECAKEISDNLGEQEVKETLEGISYGSMDVRDGVNISHHTTLKKLILPSEIVDLPNLASIVHVAGHDLRTKIKLKPKSRKAIAERYIPSPTAGSKTLSLIPITPETNDPSLNVESIKKPNLRVSRRKNHLFKATNQFVALIDDLIFEPEEEKSTPTHSEPEIASPEIVSIEEFIL